MLKVALAPVDATGYESHWARASPFGRVYALIQLARKLDIRIVAEGVEDRWTVDALRLLDCDLIQGFLVSRPLPAADIEIQLESQRCHASARASRSATISSTRSATRSPAPASPSDLHPAAPRVAMPGLGK